MFPSRLSCQTEERLQFYGGLPKRLKAMVAYLKVGPQVRTYLDYLRAAREAKKEDSIKLSWSPRALEPKQLMVHPSQGPLVSFPYRN